MREVVVNKCYGGYSISTKALLRMRELGSKEATAEPALKGEKWPNGTVNDRDWGSHGRDIPRDDKLLVQVVKELGKEANGSFAELRIVEIPEDVQWEISEYDGMEHIAEVHRTW